MFTMCDQLIEWSWSAIFSAIYTFWQVVRWPQSSNGIAPNTMPNGVYPWEFRSSASNIQVLVEWVDHLKSQGCVSLKSQGWHDTWKVREVYISLKSQGLCATWKVRAFSLKSQGWLAWVFRAVCHLRTQGMISIEFSQLGVWSYTMNDDLYES